MEHRDGGIAEETDDQNETTARDQPRGAGAAKKQATTTQPADPDPAPNATNAPDLEVPIHDPRFIENLHRVKNLHSFYSRETIGLPPGFSLGALNLMQAADRRTFSKTRAPTSEEWELLEEKLRVLLDKLTPEEKAKFYNSQVPKWIVTASLLLLVTGIVSLILALLPFALDVSISWLDNTMLVVGAYLVWLTALGSLGSIAFIGFNAIAISSDITFDVNNSRLITLRIILGALFAIIFTLPFGFSGFQEFTASLIHSQMSPTFSNEDTGAFDSNAIIAAVLLLMPFLLGYSSSLVISIISRFISAIQAFFGIQQETSARARENSF